MDGGKGPSWSVQKCFKSSKGEKERIVLEKEQWSKTGGKKGGKGQEKGGKGDARVCWSCGKTGHIAANCIKGGWNRSLNAVEEDKGDISDTNRPSRTSQDAQTESTDQIVDIGSIPMRQYIIAARLPEKKNTSAVLSIPTPHVGGWVGGWVSKLLLPQRGVCRQQNPPKDVNLVGLVGACLEFLVRSLVLWSML